MADFLGNILGSMEGPSPKASEKELAKRKKEKELAKEEEEKNKQKSWDSLGTSKFFRPKNKKSPPSKFLIMLKRYKNIIVFGVCPFQRATFPTY